MENILHTIGIGITAFIATNVDDLFLLILFFSNPRYDRKKVVLGQYLGIAALIAISMISYFGRWFLSTPWIGLMGILPIYIGIKALIEQIKSSDTEKKEDLDMNHLKSSIFSVATVTIANGGDNIGIYASLFSTSSFAQLVIFTITFFVMVAALLVGAVYLVNHRSIGKYIEKYGEMILPFVLIGLGIWILIECRTYSLFFNF